MISVNNGNKNKTMNFSQNGPETTIKPTSLDEIDFTQEKPLFFSNRTCPFAHRAWWTLLENQVDFDFIHIQLGEEKPEWYKDQVNPYGTVPCLYVQGKPVYESLIVAQYVDEVYGQGRLMPEDPLQRAAVRLVIDKLGIGALYDFLKFGGGEDREEKVRGVNQALDSVEKYFEVQSEGPFFLGEVLSLADVAFVPFLDRFKATLGHYRDFDIFEGRPRLLSLYEAAKKRPAFQVTSLDPEIYIQAYAGYPQN
eukprot:TRINITY_DN13186_c0_g1_i1.p1 TRINITY_DN13186_c0_g1~~TRINITY_DN13186_c0_g1_i1.p1  ORF type:complete len:284 (+),score=58.69 TRINITY_DN13186_c0_g1_i1:97-852(+)